MWLPTFPCIQILVSVCVRPKEHHCNNILFSLKFPRYLRGRLIFRRKRRPTALPLSRLRVYALGRWRRVTNRRRGLAVRYHRTYRKIDLTRTPVAIWSKNRRRPLRRRPRNRWRGRRVRKYRRRRGSHRRRLRRKRKLRRIRRRRKRLRRRRRYRRRRRRRRRTRRKRRRRRRRRRQKRRRRRRARRRRRRRQRRQRYSVLRLKYYRKWRSVYRRGGKLYFQFRGKSRRIR